MAVIGSNLTSNANIAGVTSGATASVSPSANNLILASINSRTNITVDPNAPTLTGNGLTWVQIATIIWDTTSTSRKRITLFRALGASPSSGAITIDFGGQVQTDFDWCIDQFSGVNTSGTNGSGAVVQSATAKDESVTATTLNVTLGAFSSVNNGTYGTIVSDGSHPLSSIASGYTQLATNETQAGGSGIDIVSMWRNDNNTSPGATFSTNSMLGGIAIEIAAAAVAVVQSAPSMSMLGVGA